MKNITLLIALILFNSGFAQKTMTIHFENKPKFKITDVKQLPVELQEITLKNLSKTLVQSTMYIVKDDVYYEKHAKTSTNKANGSGVTKKTGVSVQMLDEVSTSVEAPVSKYKKIASNNTYQELKNGKLVTQNLQKTNWKISTKTKKILGYTCYEATGTYKNNPITVYFTKELNVKASPELLPFIDGVVLEYNTGRMQGIATKIEKNQPDVKDFFKN